jgi:hypothetical protein
LNELLFLLTRIVPRTNDLQNSTSTGENENETDEPNESALRSVAKTDGDGIKAVLADDDTVRKKQMNHPQKMKKGQIATHLDSPENQHDSMKLHQESLPLRPHYLKIRFPCNYDQLTYSGNFFINCKPHGQAGSKCLRKRKITESLRDTLECACGERILTGERQRQRDMH